METITVKGKVYEIGKLYGSGKGIGGLCGHSEDGFELRKSSNKFCINAIYPIDLDSIGTIKDAPIELEDGEWYMCEYNEDITRPANYIGGEFYAAANARFEELITGTPNVLYKMIKA